MSNNPAKYEVLIKQCVPQSWTQVALVGLEAWLNSPPLAYKSPDPKDATPLTPNRFLHGQMGGDSASESSDQVTFSPRNRWRQVQEIIAHFLKRWMSEWLPLFNPRHKWTEAKPNLNTMKFFFSYLLILPGHTGLW